MSWQKELENGVRSMDQQVHKLGLSPEEAERREEIAERFPMMITPYYLSLVDTSDPDDPIARMCIPSTDEMDPDGELDTSGEASNTKLEGLQHKYPPTVLLLSTNQCAMYCRHCFRKRMVGLTEDELNRVADEAIAYVAEHEEVRNVLISGGDSLMNPNSVVERYLEGLCRIGHLDFIRFGSRLPVTLPERIYGDAGLLELFERYGKEKAIVVVTQFNHPRELTPESRRAVDALLTRGIQLRNQTVLLRGVNDSPEVLGGLLRGLTAMNVAPYYIFQCRPVRGVKGRFQVPLREGIGIVDGAKSMQSGPGKAVRYAMSHPRGKIEVIGMLPGTAETIFKFHQNKYPEDSARIFTRRLTEHDTWLDDSLEPV